MLGKKTRIVWMLLLCLLIAVLCSFVRADTVNGNGYGNGNGIAEPAGRVLLLYDSLANGTAKEGNVEALQRLLAAFGIEVTAASFDRYEPGTLGKYEQVIGVRNAADITELKAEFVKDFAAYNGAYTHIGARLPDTLRQSLGVQEERRGRDTIRLTIGSLSQPAIAVNEMPYIVQADGAGYGSIISDSGGKTSPYAVLKGQAAYIPYFEKGNLSEIAASYVIKDWLGVKGQSGYYVLFKNVYPFSNLDNLNRLADRMYEAGIPFIVSAMPVFSNIEYPAMQRYLETLKHVQSRNGTIVVNAPVVTWPIGEDSMNLSDQMTLFIDALAGYGIAPLGIGAEMYWAYDRVYSDRGMSYFDSIVQFPNGQLRHRAKTDTAKAFRSSVYTIRAEELRKFEQAGKVREPLPMNAAITFDFPEDAQQLEDTIRTIASDWTTFADYKKEAHTVRTAANEISSAKGQLRINGRTLVLNNVVEEVDPKHVYIPEGEKSFDALFTVQNNIFIALILATLIIFAGFLIVGHRLYKRKYENRERSL